MKEGFYSSPNSSRFVDWRMAGGNGPGISTGRGFADLIALEHGDSCPADRKEIGATDSNYAAAHDDNVTISGLGQWKVWRLPLLLLTENDKILIGGGCLRAACGQFRRRRKD